MGAPAVIEFGCDRFHGRPPCQQATLFREISTAKRDGPAGRFVESDALNPSLYSRFSHSDSPRVRSSAVYRSILALLCLVTPSSNMK